MLEALESEKKKCWQKKNVRSVRKREKKNVSKNYQYIRLEKLIEKFKKVTTIYTFANLSSRSLLCKTGSWTHSVNNLSKTIIIL